MAKLIHKERMNWKGVLYDLALYESDSIEGLKPITKVQAVLFTDDNNIVLYKHIDGYFGLPGGSVEENETFESALRREAREESSCEILDYGFIGYVEGAQVEVQNNKIYQLCYWAKVKLLDELVNDPCGKALSREVVNLNVAVEKLNWGERGKELINLATNKFKKNIAIKPSH